MKATSFFLSFISLCLLVGSAPAVSFPNASVTDAVCVDVSWGLTSDQALKLRAAGVSTVRGVFYGYNLKNSSGNYTWSTMDQFVTNCAQAGLRVLASLQGPSPADYGSMDDGTYYGGSH